MGLEFFIIDGNGPFFDAAGLKSEINWSKIPFSQLITGDALDEAMRRTIISNFKIFSKKIAEYGYNAVTLDDMAHMVVHEFYPELLKKKLRSLQSLYRELIDIAIKNGLKVYVTSDVMFYNSAIEKHVGKRKKAVLDFFSDTVTQLLLGFEGVSGVILRIGEADGIDVNEDFHSSLLIKNSRQCAILIRTLLRIFERFEKQLIVRTWTLGAFPIGDLIWNAETYNAVFGRFHSEYLLTSHKYGETDFFRYLNMTPLLFEGHIRKIVEFQARREYEGFGMFPSFVGFDYERYAGYLKNNPSIAGLSVWCQTGGWSHFHRYTFLGNSSVWNEINVFSTIKIFREDYTAEKSVYEFTEQNFPQKNYQQLLILLRLADRVIKELWYIPEFSSKRLYFRRTRVPPLLWVFWDNIVINHTLRKILRRFVHERREVIYDGYRTLRKIRKMKELAFELGLPADDLDFMYDTCRILATAREYYFGEWDPKIISKIEELKKEYLTNYPDGFHVLCDFSPVHFKKWLIKILFRLSIRQHPHYRVIDKLVLLHLAGLVYPLFYLWQRKRLPSFTRNQAMGIQILFK